MSTENKTLDSHNVLPNRQEACVLCVGAEGTGKHDLSLAVLQLPVQFSLQMSVQLHDLKYRTMLSDGDSTAFTAVRDVQPDGPTRLVSKLECVNHCHKRLGTALCKKAKEAGLGGRGAGKLTADKCTRLQNYFRGAVLNNLGDTEAMSNATWASLFHSTSTDDDPHHTRCPDGADSWCFYKAATARGEPVPPHAEHVGTAISHEVVKQLIPVYRRISCPALLRRIAHGKTQNANESLNNLIWVHCPKEVFVGVDRLSLAVAEAVSKFNRGNSHIAQVLDYMKILPSEIIVANLQAKDKARVKKAERASTAAQIRVRWARRVTRQLDVAHSEDAEGPTYEPGLLAKMSNDCFRDRMASSLPLPEENAATRPRIDYICFMLNMADRDSIQVVEKSLSLVDVRYFLGRACLVVSGACSHRKMTDVEQMTALADAYHLPLVFGEVKDQKDRDQLARRILSMVEIAAGFKRRISPSLIESTRVFSS